MLTTKRLKYNIKHPSTNVLAWSIWLTAGLFYTYEFVHRVAPNVMVPELMQEFGVSGQSLGNLSAFYYYAYAIAQIPVGLLLDRYSTRYLLVLAASLIAMGSFIFSETNNIYFANFSRIIVGIGSAFSFVACIRLAANWFIKKKLGLVIGLTNLLGVAGAVIAGRPLAHLIESRGWRDSINYLGLIGIGFIFLLWAVIRDRPKTSNHRKSTTRKTLKLKTQFKTLIKTPQIWFIALFGSFMVAPIASYAELWGVSFLIQKYSFVKPEAAQVVAFTFIGIAIGGPINGWISDLFNKRKPIMLFGAIGALLSFSAIIFVSNLSFLYITILHIIFGFFTSSMLLCFSLNSEIVDIKVRGTVIGFTNTLIMGISVLFQPLIGYLLDCANLGNNNLYSISSYKQAFLPLIVCLISALLILVFIKEQKSKRS